MHACDWPCNWVEACWQVSACKCVSNGESVWERQRYMPTRKGQMSELIGWFFFLCFLCSAGERQGAGMVWSVHHDHVLPAFTCLLFRFCGCTCTRRFHWELWGHWRCEFCWRKCWKRLYPWCLRAWFFSSPRQILWLNEMDSNLNYTMGVRPLHSQAKKAEKKRWCCVLIATIIYLFFLPVCFLQDSLFTGRGLRCLETSYRVIWDVLQ